MNCMINREEELMIIKVIIIGELKEWMMERIEKGMEKRIVEIEEMEIKREIGEEKELM